jgi:hypothetical protein
MDLGEVSVGELLSLSRAIVAELRRREVIRSGNAPAGDYPELLVLPLRVDCHMWDGSSS